MKLQAASLFATAPRMTTEERLVARRYPGYTAHARRTRRFIPFIF
jgi:protein-S-isoprenylcysteine O-methyltransferase Ste14